MRMHILATLYGLAATVAVAPRVQAQVVLDSGAVVRLRWTDGAQKARLLAPLGPDSSTVTYCVYPSPICGGSTSNPRLTRPVNALVGLEVRRGSRTGHGAFIGACVGAIGSLVVLARDAYSDRPAASTGHQVLTAALITGVWSGLGALVGAASDNWEPVAW
jgi:hypothetical protein